MDQAGSDPQFSLYNLGQQAGLPQTPMHNGYQQQQHFQQGSPYGGGGGRGGRGRNRGRQSRGGGGGGWGGGGGGWGGGMAGSGSMQEDRQRTEDERGRRVRERLYKLGETDDGQEFFAQSDLFTIKKWIEEEARKGSAQEQTVLKAFRVMVTEQPHKMPLVAALLGFLIISPDGQRVPNKSDGGNEESATDSVDHPESLGLKIAKDLVKAFRSHLHSRLWRNVRLSLHFFASLVPLGIVAPSSMRALLSAFSMVLNEPGVTVDRGDRAAVCIVEVLCRSGSDLIRADTLPAEALEGEAHIDVAALEEINSMVDAVEAYAKGRRSESSLQRAWAPSIGEEAEKDPLHEEGFEQAVEALILLRSRQYKPPAFLPAAKDLLPPAIVAISKDLLREQGGMTSEQYRIAMPEVLVPPEEDDSEAFSFHLKDGKPGSSRSRRSKKTVTLEKADEEVRRAGAGPERTAVFARWFVESTPLVGTPSAVIMRSLVNEVIDLYEVNRKECARILFGIAKWFRKGTFTGKAVSSDTGLFGDAEDLDWILADSQDPQGGWTIDDVVVECILSASLLLPQSPHVPLYYHSLLREITTLSPQTLAPAIGRTVRRVFGASRTGRVSAEVLERFADWFSAHLSNFNFSWGWKEWIPDMKATHSHPAKSFARRVAELEVRLAYYDRIKGTLPEEIQLGVLRPEEPTPCFTYESPEHPYYARATALNNSLRARATAPVVLAELESLKRDLIAVESTFPQDDDPMSGGKVSTEAEADIIVRDIMTQVVLNIGSRSFSHFLNIVERYHALLRQLSSTPSMRLAILTSTTRFWARSPQWVRIVLDKLMQYRIVEPADVIAFVFDPPTADSLPQIILSTSGDAVPASFSKLIPLPGGGYTRDWANFDWFEILRLTIEKVNGRVGQVRRRLARLQREEAEEAERKEAAAAAIAAEVVEDGPSEAAAVSTPAPKVPFSFPTSASLPRRPDLPTSTPMASTAPGGDKGAVDAGKKKLAEEEKRQTVEETKSALDSILTEQRKVLAGAFKGLADHYRNTSALAASAAAAAAAAAAGAGEDDEGEVRDETAEAAAEELEWKAWWAREWYLAYLRQFNREFATIQETLSAVFVHHHHHHRRHASSSTAQDDHADGSSGDEVRTLFEEACRMAYE